MYTAWHFGKLKLNHSVEKMLFSVELECNQARFRHWHILFAEDHTDTCYGQQFLLSFFLLLLLLFPHATLCLANTHLVLQSPPYWHPQHSSALTTCSAKLFQRSSIIYARCNLALGSLWKQEHITIGVTNKIIESQSSFVFGCQPDAFCSRGTPPWLRSDHDQRVLFRPLP